MTALFPECLGHQNTCHDNKYRRALRTSEGSAHLSCCHKLKQHFEIKAKRPMAAKRRLLCECSLCWSQPEYMLTTHYAPGTTISQGCLHEPDSQLVASQSLAPVSGVQGSRPHPEC